MRRNDEMVRKAVTVVTVVDDLNGAQRGVKTRRFEIDGMRREIDLTDANFAKMLRAMDRFVQASRPVGSSGAVGSAGMQVRSRREDLAQIRAWAQENGFTVNSRGRIPAHVINAYDAAAATSVVAAMI